MSTKAERNEMVDVWKGEVVVCVASGPSVSKEEIERVREWHERKRGIVIAVNTSFLAVPWADAVYAMDKKWWMFYSELLDKHFRGLRIGRHEMIQRYSVIKLHDFNAYNNSGAGAISLAARAGARRVVLLGYNLCHAHGQVHHHGDHPRGLGNARSVGSWPRAFSELRQHLDRMGVEYFNSTRNSLLDWPWLDLKEALALG